MRLGTRGSALALAQARSVAAALGGDAEIVTITTVGDRGAGIGDKARWTSTLEEALLAGEIDIAVHSAKDVPGELADGCSIVGAPARADARDALVGAASLDALPDGARIGTSSLRRAAQMRAARGALAPVELRGNVDTRLRKLADGQADALVLALAGLQRLGRAEEVGAVPLEGLVPAPGQGTLALEVRTGDAAANAAAAAVSDPVTLRCLRAERAAVRTLGATCHTPVGAYATTLAGGRLRMVGFAGLPDGSHWIRDELEGDEPEALGAALAQRMEAAGARELLAQAEAMANP